MSSKLNGLPSLFAKQKKATLFFIKMKKKKLSLDEYDQIKYLSVHNEVTYFLGMIIRISDQGFFLFICITGHQLVFPS